MTPPFTPKGSTILVLLDPVFQSSPIARPDITAGQERPQSGEIVAIGQTVSPTDYPVGRHISFHPSAGYEWSVGDESWLVLDMTEVRIMYPELPPDEKRAHAAT